MCLANTVPVSFYNKNKKVCSLIHNRKIGIASKAKNKVNLQKKCFHVSKVSNALAMYFSMETSSTLSDTIRPCNGGLIAFRSKCCGNQFQLDSLESIQGTCRLSLKMGREVNKNL